MRGREALAWYERVSVVRGSPDPALFATEGILLTQFPNRPILSLRKFEEETFGRFHVRGQETRAQLW